MILIAKKGFTFHDEIGLHCENVGIWDMQLQQGFASIVSKLRDVFMEHAMMVNEKVNCMYAAQLKIIY